MSCRTQERNSIHTYVRMHILLGPDPASGRPNPALRRPDPASRALTQPPGGLTKPSKGFDWYTVTACQYFLMLVLLKNIQPQRCQTATQQWIMLRKVFGFTRWESIRYLRELFSMKSLYDIFKMSQDKFLLSCRSHHNPLITFLASHFNSSHVWCGYCFLFPCAVNSGWQMKNTVLENTLVPL